MSLNVSVGKLEGYAREKVEHGEYGSISEVVREGLRLLKKRDELWKAKIQAKIEEGMASLRAGRVIPAEIVQANVEARIADVERRRGSH